MTFTCDGSYIGCRELLAEADVHWLFSPEWLRDNFGLTEADDDAASLATKATW
jgi:hypothetical protein